MSHVARFLLSVVFVGVVACGPEPVPVVAPPPPTVAPVTPPPVDAKPPVDVKPPGDATPPSASSCAGAPPKPSYVCAIACGPPVARPTDPPPAHVWADPAQVRDGRIANCPICLPPSALVATPTGGVRADALRAGLDVLTLDASGRRVAAKIERVGSVEVGPSHELLRVELDDGRVLRASPGHPTAEGRRLDALRAGDALDGARVKTIAREALPGTRTFDLLPAGATGAYWADGVLVGSTLKR